MQKPDASVRDRLSPTCRSSFSGLLCCVPASCRSFSRTLPRTAAALPAFTTQQQLILLLLLLLHPQRTGLEMRFHGFRPIGSGGTLRRHGSSNAKNLAKQTGKTCVESVDDLRPEKVICALQSAQIACHPSHFSHFGQSGGWLCSKASRLGASPRVVACRMHRNTPHSFHGGADCRHTTLSAPRTGINNGSSTDDARCFCHAALAFGQPATDYDGK